MRHQIAADAHEPSRADGVEARQLQQIEQRRGGRVVGPVGMMRVLIVKSPAQSQAISKGAQPAHRGRGGRCERHIRVGLLGERPQTDTDRFDRGVREGPRHGYFFPGAGRVSNTSSSPMLRW